jgi:hypothetical protein
MVDIALAGRCGIYCVPCGIYCAYLDVGEHFNYIAKSWEIPREKLRCRGCQALTPDCWGTGCERLKCFNEKGYRYCYKCKEFRHHSCVKYESVASRYLERGQNTREALLRIEIGEMEKWLEEQERRWYCPSCGNPTSWYDERCYSCGKPLEKA